ncbi:peptide/nickel transport system permease protein [Pseudonocardia sediminis]|uniref:Peptide/nickel transport system permease protein n=1 Tax=Pseudonocardia sediminis TaxID=1397368 RepID=A0A4Q7V1G0_PSEST|nr:ABC transporter permease [Pseudonocardia sediminis]RZT88352.1 peptide/nickel transport system permease protein [Pseudonocardia sediminis]
MSTGLSLPVSRRRGREVARLVGTRLALGIPVVAAVAVLVFLLAAASPFDPVFQYFGAGILDARESDIAAVRAQLGLDDPVGLQLLRWIGGLLTGDLGQSLSLRQPVATVIAERLPWTVLLAVVSLVVTVVLSLVAGVAAAWRQGGWLDRAVTAVGHTLEGLPPFVLALGAIAVFAVAWPVLPVAGLTDAGAPATVDQVARHLVLPAVVLGVSQTPWLVLHVRASLLAALDDDHVTGARARGLAETTVVLRHALPTALLPFVTVLGNRLPELVTGAVLVETVFSWPGIAGAVVTAALAVDFPLLGALTLLTTVAVLLGSLAADVAVVLLDPRVAADG